MLSSCSKKLCTRYFKSLELARNVNKITILKTSKEQRWNALQVTNKDLLIITILIWYIPSVPVSVNLCVWMSIFLTSGVHGSHNAKLNKGKSGKIVNVKMQKIKESCANQADAQYTDRNKLDLAVPNRPFPSIV